MRLLHVEASKYVLCLVSTSVNFPSGAVEHPNVPAARIFDTLPDHWDQILTVSFCGGVVLVELDPVPPEVLLFIVFCPCVVVCTEGVTPRCLESNTSEHFFHVSEPQSVVITGVNVSGFIVENMLRGGGQGYEVYQLTLFRVGFTGTVLAYNVTSYLEPFLDFFWGARVDGFIVSVVYEGYFDVIFSSTNHTPKVFKGPFLDNTGEEGSIKSRCHISS